MAQTTPINDSRSQGELVQALLRHFNREDVPIAYQIARCESGGFQYINGEVVKGKITPQDRGVFQISLKYHSEELAKRGLDVHKLEDNVKFASILFYRDGLQPWIPSRDCWINA